MMVVKGKFAHRIGHGKKFTYLNNNGRPALNPPLLPSPALSLWLPMAHVTLT
jgi:hypothetical protein